MGQWSIVDVYLNWAVSTAAKGGFDFTPYPRLQELRPRLMERPAFRRTMQLDEPYFSQLYFAPATTVMMSRRVFGGVRTRANVFD